MHPNTSLVFAALASSAAAQVNVVHVLEKLQVVPRGSSAADSIFARQKASDEECNSSLSSIVQAMPTLPSDFIQYAITATEEAPSSCTLALPLSFSKPIMDSVTAFAHWGADKSQDAIQYMENCDEQGLNDPDSPQIINPGDMIAGECSVGAVILFTEGSTTSTVKIDSVIEELATEIRDSMLGGSASGVATKTSASTPASGSAVPTSSGSGSESDSASGTGADESAASGAAQSTGADAGSGAARSGLAAVGVAAMAGVAALFVSL